MFTDGAFQMKINFYLLGSALIAALGGLLFGFDTAVISGTTEWLKREFRLTDFTLGFTVASALIGTLGLHAGNFRLKRSQKSA